MIYRYIEEKGERPSYLILFLVSLAVVGRWLFDYFNIFSVLISGQCWDQVNRVFVV